jgi:hypothetical protein
VLRCAPPARWRPRRLCCGGHRERRGALSGCGGSASRNACVICVARLSRSTPCFAVIQDFGARDPFVGEIVTGFGNTPLGNADTMHNVK